MNRQALIWALGVAVVATSVYLLIPRPAVAPQQHMLPYASEEGYTFQYPDTYELSSRPGAPGGGDTLVLLPKGYTPPEAGEGPPVISVESYSNAEGLPLEVFLANEPRTNWSMVVGERGTKGITVGGKPGVWYHYSGLYEVDAVAVAHRGRVYIISGNWLEPSDQIRADFNALIQTMQFN